MASSNQTSPIYPNPSTSQSVSEDHDNEPSLTSGLLDSRSEGHQRLVASSIVTVVTGLALEFNVDEAR